MPSLVAFLSVAALLVVTPGPDMALVTRHALAGGRRAALLTAFGIEAGLLVWTGASALGLATLLQTSAFAFTIVKLVGAAYLLYLGLPTLLAVRRGGGTATQPSRSAPGVPTVGSPFQQGLVCNLLNPKIAVFFTSLIPQFVTEGPSAVWQSTILAGVLVLLGLVWLVDLALFAGAAGAFVHTARVKREIDGVTGSALVGFGVRLANEVRSARIAPV